MTHKIMAFHYDLKRAMWTGEFMDRYAATLADWGYNTILYEVEDKLRYSRHPKLAHADSLTPEATQTRMGALRRRGFDVIPLVQTLGHAECVLTRPGYERFRESPAHTDQYDPLSDDVQALIRELLDETIEALRPERYVHLGGDETWALGQSERCRPEVAEIGKGGLYLRHMLPIVEHVIERGLRPILWADIALTHPDIVDRFPRDLVWMDWDYWTVGERTREFRIWGLDLVNWQTYRAARQADKIAPRMVEYIEKYAVDARTRRDRMFSGFPYTDALRDMGFEVLVAPATRSYGDSMGIPMNSVHQPNCFFGARKGRESGLGACVTSWAVRHSHPLVNLVGAFAATRGVETDAPYDLTAVVSAFAETRFAVAMPELAEALRLAEVRVPWCESRELKPLAPAGCEPARGRGCPGRNN